MMTMTKNQQLERQNKDLKTLLSNLKAKQELAEVSYQEQLASLKNDLGSMPDQIKQLREHNAKKDEIIAKQKEKIITLKNENTKLSKSLEKAKQLIGKLRARLRKDSSTSDKPSSTDAFKKPKPQSLREKSGKKPGGQPGHAGHTLPIYPNPTRIIEIKPENCSHCGCAVEITGDYAAKQKVDIEVIVNVTEERAFKGICPDCGKATVGEFNDGFKSQVSYGDNVKAATALISEHGFVSVSKTAEIISSLTGGAVNLSWGTVVNMQKELSRKLEDTIDIIRAGLIAGKVIGADETGCRVNGSLDWIQIFCNEDFALFGLNENRGAIDGNLGILAYFVGILVHDHLSSYYKYATLTHAECNEHVLRVLKGLAEIFKHGWIQEMSELLKRACHEKNELVRRNETAMPQEKIEEFTKEYEAILQKGWREYSAATNGNKSSESYYVEEKRLLARLGEFKEEHLLFLNDFDAPFTNNLSEQGIRKVKGKLKVAGCFRSLEGAIAYARIASLITTLIKQDKNVFEGIRLVYSGQSPMQSSA